MLKFLAREICNFFSWGGGWECKVLLHKIRVLLDFAQLFYHEISIYLIIYELWGCG